MKYPQIPLAQQVIQACKLKEIRHIVISPGSRNAPLIIGFSLDSFFTSYSIVDERCAGFFALGLAQQLQEPVAVVCTSGSAVLNYYPAVSEAFYSNIPLVVISADRPSDKIDIGDGQTIRQKGIFVNHSAYNANLSDDVNLLKFNEYELNNALNSAFEKKMPVHINVPFEEPLYGLSETIISFENQPFIKKEPTISFEFKQKFISEWNSAKKKVILVGVLPPNSLENKWLSFFENDPSVLVLTETTSNITHSSHIEMIDSFLTALEENSNLQKEFYPEMLITMGGMVISKKIKDIFRKNPPKTHFHIDNFVGYDTFFCLTHYFKTEISAFFEEISPLLLKVSSEYKLVFQQFMTEVLQKRNVFLESIPYSDMKVYQSVFQLIPEKTHLQISNSAAIRYAQLFPKKKGWEVFCNRGTSGIDGSTSTAIGASLINSKSTTFVTGDLSFFYNSNALWCAYVPASFRLILVNNDGGGIFRILPANRVETFETFFETPHGFSAEKLCEMYGWNYIKATDIEQVNSVLEHFFNPTEKPCLLEIFTPRQENDVVLKSYFNYLKIR